MPYLNCPRCSLSVRVKPHAFVRPACPRCQARDGVSMPMYKSLEPPTFAPVTESVATEATGDPMVA